MDLKKVTFPFPFKIHTSEAPTRAGELSAQLTEGENAEKGLLQNEIAIAVCTKEASITRQKPLQESCFGFLGGGVFVQYFGASYFATGPESNKQCEGRLTPTPAEGGLRRPPQRDPIFRDAKVLLFWCDQQQKEYWLDTPFCCHIGWVFTRVCRRSLTPAHPLHQIQYGALYLL